MRTFLAATALAVAGLTALPAVAESQAYQYNWITGRLPGSDIIGATVVRAPAFTGDQVEQGEALVKATEAIEADYCGAGEKFMAAQDMMAFDPSQREWVIGGKCVAS